jgi:hypothetical protein
MKDDDWGFVLLLICVFLISSTLIGVLAKKPESNAPSPPKK